MSFEYPLKNAYVGQGIWKPWSNTLCYLPLEKDVLDYSWNNNNWTGNPANFNNWVANYTTGSSWGSTYLPYSLVNTNEWTVSIWVYWGTTTTNFLNQHTLNTWWFTMWYKNNWSNAAFGWESDITTTSVANAWNLFTWTWDSNWYKFYYNWVYIWSQSSRTTRTNQNLYLGYDGYTGHINITLSKLIIENKARTWDEILEYYNLTKNKYI